MNCRASRLLEDSSSSEEGPSSSWRETIVTTPQRQYHTPRKAVARTKPSRSVSRQPLAPQASTPLPAATFKRKKTELTATFLQE